MDEVFQEQSLVWERGASVDVDFDLWTFKIFYMHQNKYKTVKKRKKMKKHERSPLTFINRNQFYVFPLTTIKKLDSGKVKKKKNFKSG